MSPGHLQPCPGDRATCSIVSKHGELPMKIVVHGAGSIGCFVGGAWAAAGLDVAFIGRERIREAVAREGLTLTDYSGWRERLAPERVEFGTKPAALAKADVILLAVKSTGTAEAAKEIARNAR